MAGLGFAGDAGRLERGGFFSSALKNRSEGPAIGACIEAATRRPRRSFSWVGATSDDRDLIFQDRQTQRRCYRTTR
jgi:hypothetical protein